MGEPDPYVPQAPAETDAVSERPVNFEAADGWPLAGLVIAPKDPHAVALITAGTGFPKEYYRRFALDGARRGYACFLFDYRGIGGSAPDRLGAMVMDYPDWGRLDIPAAIDAAGAAVPGVPLVHVGHSVGGHFVGFASNQDRIARHTFVAVGSGYWGRHHRTYNPLELWFWWGVGPLDLATRGHITRTWGGEPLPRGVFTTWRRWCHTKRYFLDELATTLRPHHFDAVRAPIRSMIYTDDPIATPRTAADLMEAYPNADAEIVVKRPADYGLSKVGHAGAFRRAGAATWDDIWGGVTIPS